MKTVILTKKNYPNKNKIKKISDLIISVPGNETARIQELHILVGHLMCAAVDEYF